ncbi:MAG: glycosyltransferase [Bacilli bacterium]
MKVFQRGLFNTNTELCNVQEMYFRTNSNSKFENSINLENNEFFETNTYFNCVSVDKLKRHTNIKDIACWFEFKGYVKISFFNLDNDLKNTKLFEVELDAKEKEIKKIDIVQWDFLSEGLLYFRIDVLSELELFNFYYSTESCEINNVKLAIVITHFNRQDYLLPALKRIQADIINNYENIDVIVSDNSQNLGFEDNDRIKVYKNKNYGGSGGFTFGLLKAMEKGYTHCLFMDDDASTESECILRTYDILSFIREKNIAISGSMLYEKESNILHESGARIKNGIEAINCGLDLKLVESLIINDVDEKIEYGGWWFFAFSLSDVDVLPYPFFVKGDDMCFSVSNNFEILTINGICSWQEDFLVKHNAFSQYLSSRSWAVLNLLSIDQRGFFGFLNLYIFDIIRGLLINQYDLSRIALLAYRDLIFDGNLWLDNIDMVVKREQIIKMVKYEKYLPNDLDFSYLEVNYGKKKIVEECFFRKVVRIFTFNGLLIPSVFFSKETLIVPKNYFRLSEVFLRKNVLYVDLNNNTAFKVVHNKFVILFYLFYFLLMFCVLVFSYPILKKSYKKKYADLTKKEFWLKILDLD